MIIINITYITLTCQIYFEINCLKQVIQQKKTHLCGSILNSIGSHFVLYQQVPVFKDQRVNKQDKKTDVLF